jgi:type IV pilus assembly protein PilV
MPPASGFTLLEVLIAFFVLSIGLMGVAGLQSLSKSSQFEAIQRSRAIALTGMAIEMMRNNPNGARDYIASGLGGGSITSEPTPNCLGASACSPAQLAAHDLWSWEQAMDGQGVFVTDAGNPVPQAALADVAGCIRRVANSAPGATADPTDAAGPDTGEYLVLIQWRGLERTTDGVAEADDYCAGAGVGSDPFRRLVVVGTYIVDEAEL